MYTLQKCFWTNTVYMKFQPRMHFCFQAINRIQLLMKMLTLPKEQWCVTNSIAEANWFSEHLLIRGIYSMYLIKAWILNYAKNIFFTEMQLIATKINQHIYFHTLRGLSNPDTNSLNILIRCLNIHGSASKGIQIFIYSFLYGYSEVVTVSKPGYFYIIWVLIRCIYCTFCC